MSGIATISYGRFPTNAHFIEQVLWLVCVNDPESLSKLENLHFSNSFDSSYNPGELDPQSKKSGSSPDLVASIRWYAPGYVQALGSTNRYKLAVYPDGWLKAEVSVTGSKNVGKMALPTKITYTQYFMKGGTNLAEYMKLQKTITGPEDVVPIETCSFSVTTAQAESPLPSYVPQPWDAKIRVNDMRIQRIFLANPQKWLEGAKIFKIRDKPTPDQN